MTSAHTPPRILAAILLLIGLLLLLGGLALAVQGGSWFFAPAGLLASVAALALWRGRRVGLVLFGALYAVTLIWSLWETGLDPWALVSRLSLWTVLGVWLLLPWSRRGLQR